MSSPDKLVHTLMASILGCGVAVSSTHAQALSLEKCYGIAKKGATITTPSSRKMVKCYGIVKAGKNDCGSPYNACAGQSKVNGDPQQWLYVLKGNCAVIAGATTTAPKNMAQKPLTTTQRSKMVDAQTAVWVYKGNCEKIVGGSSTPPKNT